MLLQGKKPDLYEHLSPDARDAMAAVEQAMKGLPPLEDLKMSVFEGDGGFGARPADEPPNAGSKVVSKSAPLYHESCPACAHHSCFRRHVGMPTILASTWRRLAVLHV